MGYYLFHYKILKNYERSFKLKLGHFRDNLFDYCIRSDPYSNLKDY